jgi:hypothetical protein
MQAAMIKLQLATKSDLNDLVVSLKIWLICTIIVVAGLALAIDKLM